MSFLPRKTHADLARVCSHHTARRTKITILVRAITSSAPTGRCKLRNTSIHAMRMHQETLRVLLFCPRDRRATLLPMTHQRERTDGGHAYVRTLRFASLHVVPTFAVYRTPLYIKWTTGRDHRRVSTPNATSPFPGHLREGDSTSLPCQWQSLILYRWPVPDPLNHKKGIIHFPTRYRDPIQHSQ